MQLFRSSRTGDRDFSLDVDRLATTLATLRALQSRSDTVLFGAQSYESLVQDESRFGLSPLRRSRNSHFVLEDNENGLRYTLGRPSDGFVLYLLARVDEIASVRLLRSPVFTTRLRQLDLFEGTPDIFAVVHATLPRVLTVRVDSAKAKGVTDLARHANAFLFQLTYNLDAPVVESRYLEDLVRSGRIVRERRSQLDDLAPPRRFYTPDLVYHYQMGVATDSPLLEYLSFYHVAEHFFEEVYNDDLINSVRERITQPDFSYRRKKDINELIREINRRLRIRGDAVAFSELEALRLTLARFVDPADLVTKVRAYDESLPAYFATTAVSFSGGDVVQLDDADSEKVIAALAKRIYKTRNAIVHSKEGDKGRYVPFQHDRVLVKELPLLRFIAEAIIVRTSQLFA